MRHLLSGWQWGSVKGSGLTLCTACSRDLLQHFAPPLHILAVLGVRNYIIWHETKIIRSTVFGKIMGSSCYLLQHTCTLWELVGFKVTALCHCFFLFACDSRNQNICLSFLRQPDRHWSWQSLSLYLLQNNQVMSQGWTLSRATQPCGRNFTHVWLFTFMLIVSVEV